MNGTTIHEAQSQYFSRPRDQRFETLEALETSVLARRNRTQSWDVPTGSIVVTAKNETDIIVNGKSTPATPTHWSFGQLSSAAGAPSGYLRKLPAPLAVDCLRHGLRHSAIETPSDAVKLMVTADDDEGDAFSLRAVTSPTYGRIWDADVVRSLRESVALADDKWFNPPEWGGKPGGLYASDRDLYALLINGGSIVNGGGERDQLHRGVIVSNSEVGKATLRVQAFLFRAVCGNHLITGVEKYEEIAIRHTLYAPERFASEFVPGLKAFAAQSTKPIEDAIHKAKDTLLPADAAERIEWLVKRGFNKLEAKSAMTLAEQEEGDARTLWNIVNGLTAYARNLAWVDARVDLETRAGKLLAA
jgi:hypothetical protein